MIADRRRCGVARTERQRCVIARIERVQRRILVPARPATGELYRRAGGLPDVPTVPGRHRLPEEQPAAIADHVARLARV